MAKYKDYIGKTKTFRLIQNDPARCHVTFRAENGSIAFSDVMMLSGDREDDGAAFKLLSKVEFKDKALKLFKMWREGYPDEEKRLRDFLQDARDTLLEACVQTANIEHEIKHRPKHSHVVVPELILPASARKK